jgi:hypothetical protein
MSVKYWWVGPREQVLNVPIACWYMGPASVVADRQQKLDFCQMLHWLLWERSWVRTHGSVSCRAVDCVKSPSWGQWICSNLLTVTWKVVIRGPCEIHMVEGHTRTGRRKRVACSSGFPLQGVHQFESSWLSYMSIACLWQSSHSNLINLIWLM